MQTDDLASSLQRAGFVDVGVVAKPESREFIKDWLPGSKAEDFVVAANVTATKPGNGAAPSSATAARDHGHGHGHGHGHEHTPPPPPRAAAADG